ncbi:MAG: hypothetical protein U9N46_13205 [Euryarchaeota archaeon]|nr:hypothetical protein [Euryarchaeota archaeon]
MKISILLGITMTLLLLAPSASASDHTLEIFGNANEDDTIMVMFQMKVGHFICEANLM